MPEAGANAPKHEVPRAADVSVGGKCASRSTLLRHFIPIDAQQRVSRSRESKSNNGGLNL